MPVKYDPNLPTYFNNQIKFLNEYLTGIDKQDLNKTTMYEKQEIKWFSYDDMKKNRHKFRNFYREIIDKLLDERDKRVKKERNKTKKHKKGEKQKQRKTKTKKH